MMGGLTLANVGGVPIGSFIGHYTGWRGPFWALTVLAALAAAFVGRFIPRTEQWPRRRCGPRYGPLGRDGCGWRSAPPC
ncbi:hypothetical protein ACFZAV_21765 [Streptomyces sp. NPDC008343]|uniref:hypothetical protein n=1 Tax=Streptomyces sp. NPDC008343 TaxID=3364828 RepID=UPI0036E9A24B